MHLRERENRNNDGLQYKAEREIPFFSEDVSALTYLVWKRKINELHPFFARNSTSYILSFCISRFEGHASERWSYR